MLELVLRRLAWMVVVLLCVSVITFMLIYVGGNPVVAYISDQTPPQTVQQVIKRHHLDDPIYVQYVYYLDGLIHGDWGISRSAGNLPVTSAIRQYFPASVELGMLSVFLSLLIALPLGVLSAMRRNSVIDNVARIVSLSGVSIPVFWLALLLQFVFYFVLKSAHLPYLPQGGRLDVSVSLDHPLHVITGLYLVDSVITGNWAVFVNALEHLIMPAFTLAFASLGIITRLTRSSMLEVMERDYVTVARAKGVKEWLVVWKHAMRNALVPIVTITGLRMGAVLSGAVLVETVFYFPGVGLWAVKAITASDSAAIMAFVLLVAVVRSVINLLTDISYSLLDPKIRTG